MGERSEDVPSSQVSPCTGKPVSAPVNQQVFEWVCPFTHILLKKSLSNLGYSTTLRVK